MGSLCADTRFVCKLLSLPLTANAKDCELIRLTTTARNCELSTLGGGKSVGE